MPQIDRQVVDAKVAIEEEWPTTAAPSAGRGDRVATSPRIPVERGDLGYSIGIATLQACADAYGEIDVLIRLDRRYQGRPYRRRR